MTDKTKTGSAARSAPLLSNWEVLRFAAGLWLRRPLLFFSAVGFTLLAIGFELALPAAVAHIIDLVAAENRSGPALGRACAYLVGALMGLLISLNLALRCWYPLTAANMRSLISEGFEHVQDQSADWHSSHFAGATVRQLTRAMWGYDALSQTVTMLIGPSLLVLIGLATMTLLRHPLAGVMAFGTVGLYVAGSVFLAARYVRPAQIVSNEIDADMGGRISDALSANSVVKSFNAEVREARQISRLASTWSSAAVRTWNRFANVWLAQNLLLVVMQAGLVVAMVYAWANRQATPGDVGFALTASTMMSTYLRNLGEHVRGLQKGIDDTEPAAAYARLKPRVADSSGAPDFKPLGGEIVFEAVSFAYPSLDKPIYDGLSLTIRAGEHVALVGPTGSGKSTLVKLIQRLFDVQSGRILIDGQDIVQVKQQSLRRCIAVVPQDAALFHRSVFENIAYGSPGASKAEVVSAAKRARAHDFIVAMPDAYDTVVGERGTKLSGGERQRVAIARAFLVDAPILVLDEATSSLDEETEAEVQAAIEALATGRTTITIAHRLSTVERADRILVFRDGVLTEEGRHLDLLARNGSYARLRAPRNGLARSA